MGDKQTLNSDLWGTYLSEMKEAPETFYGAGDSHILFVGKPQSGKTALQNVFFGKSDEATPTIALNYQCCNIKSHGKEKTLHFWELGDVLMEGILSSIVNEHTQKGFTVFICFDLSLPSSYIECLEWIELIESRFKEGCHAMFLVGTHYDLFEPKWPQDKEMIVQGLRLLAAQHNAGLIFTSTKMETLVKRFKNVIKHVCIVNGQLKEKIVDYYGPVIVGPGVDDELQSNGNEIADLVNKMNIESATEKRDKSSQSLRSVNGNPNYAEEDIDSLASAKKTELRMLSDKIK